MSREVTRISARARRGSWTECLHRPTWMIQSEATEQQSGSVVNQLIHRVWLKASLTIAVFLTIICAPAYATVALPDARAWEMVSPQETGLAGVAGLGGISGGGLIQAAPNGDAVVYASLGSFADARGAPLGNQYLGVRSPEGWSVTNLTPPLVASGYGSVGVGTPYKAFSEDLSQGLLANGDGSPSLNPRLSKAAPEGYQNYYIIDTQNPDLRTVFTENSAPFFFETSGHMLPGRFSLTLVDATPDLSHIVFASNAVLTAGGASGEMAGENLYEWVNNELTPINVFPDGTPSPQSTLGTFPYEERTISNNGRRVFWSPETGRHLYMFESGQPTVEIDHSQSSGESGGGFFATASTNGESVFFRDGSRLTSDSTAGGISIEGGLSKDLYLYKRKDGSLEDLTTEDKAGADVLGVVGASEDCAYVYFVAAGVLSEASNRHGETAVSGADNLYVYEPMSNSKEGSVIRFIARLTPQDEHEPTLEPGVAHDWAATMARKTARVTPDGKHLVFMSTAELTGYNNVDRTTGLPDEEIYEYSAEGGEVKCVSCRVNGQAPTGGSSIPMGTPFREGGEGGATLYRSRALSNDGRKVFFESRDAIVPEDTDGVQDVYEYEDGSIYLISGGTASTDSFFLDADADGSDVFFITQESLVPQDENGLVDLYDARAPHEAGETVKFPAGGQLGLSSCNGENCRKNAEPPPVFGAMASETPVGIGNLLATKPVITEKASHKRSTMKKQKKRGKRDRTRRKHARSGRVMRVKVKGRW